MADFAGDKNYTEIARGYGRADSLGRFCKMRNLSRRRRGRPDEAIAVLRAPVGHRAGRVHAAGGVTPRE
jgi:hypothetical protein